MFRQPHSHADLMLYCEALMGPSPGAPVTAVWIKSLSRITGTFLMVKVGHG